MAIDDALLAQAREAELRVSEAEKALELAKADHRHAIRRLHLAGASFREIASTLGMSHQRVHQIIDTTGGARRWRKKLPVEPLACSFCGHPQRAVKKLVCGPAVFICNDCVSLAQGVATSGTPVETRRTAMTPLPSDQATERCHFCGKNRRQVTALVAGPGHHICAACLELCQEIIAEELQ